MTLQMPYDSCDQAGRPCPAERPVAKSYGEVDKYGQPRFSVVLPTTPPRVANTITVIDAPKPTEYATLSAITQIYQFSGR